MYAFSYDGKEITDRRTVIKFNENEIPDGMCVDSEDVLSEKILFGDLKAAEIILVGTTIEDEKEIFTFKGMPKTEMPDTPGHLAEAPTPQ